MIENIAIIASIISAITAMTTSLRAIGISHELARQNSDDLIKTGSRLGGNSGDRPASQRQNLGMYLLSTVIWYCLSIAAAAPSIYTIWKEQGLTFFLVAMIPFLILFIIIFLVWFNIIQRKN